MAVTYTSLRRFVFTSLFLIPVLLLPARAFAQDATVTGTITDSTGGVIANARVKRVVWHHHWHDEPPPFTEARHCKRDAGSTDVVSLGSARPDGSLPTQDEFR